MSQAGEPEKAPFPRTFYFANGIELFERLAYYGMYVGLSLYLTSVVGFDDKDSGDWMGNFGFVNSLAPVFCGAIADRITFKRSLVLAFCLYATGYLGLFAYPSTTLAPLSLMLMAVGGGFMKPVILGTVVRTAPEGRQTEGFSIFYRMINAGSVIGKPLAYLSRTLVSLRYVMLNSVVASLVALGIAVFGYREPEKGGAKPSPFVDTLKGYGTALKNLRFTIFLVIFAGFYFMAQQFYMTFPKYVTRVIDPNAKFEFITLVNPAVIALLQGVVTAATRRLSPLGSMIAGILVASSSMFVMGVLPGLGGALASGAIFALAEMTFSPRFYDYIASFAPEGKAGMYMGLAFVPPAIGAWVGGRVSGSLIALYLPAEGPKQPFTVWSTYAAIGLGCAFLMVIYRAVFSRPASPSPTAGA